MQVHAPECVAEHFMHHALRLQPATQGAGLRTGRGIDLHAEAFAQSVNAKQVRSVRNGKNRTQVILAGNRGQASGRLFRVRALGFSDDIRRAARERADNRDRQRPPCPAGPRRPR